jgi:type 1 glutamine amidotransferase
MRLSLIALLLATPLLLADSKPAPDAPLTLHIISGSGEYKSDPSLKEFKEYLEKTYRVKVTASWGKDGASRLDDLEDLAKADVMLVFARRMKLPEEQMKLIRAHWQAGKPILGIRTAGHAFQEADNLVFDREVMGTHYKGHGGNVPVEVTNTDAGKDHPVLAGVQPFRSRKIYGAGPLAKDTLVLQTGTDGKGTHPVTMVHTCRGGRVFFTSLGVPEDFQDTNFRRMLTNALFWVSQRDPEKMKR